MYHIIVGHLNLGPSMSQLLVIVIIINWIHIELSTGADFGTLLFFTSPGFVNKPRTKIQAEMNKQLEKKLTGRSGGSSFSSYDS